MLKIKVKLKEILKERNITQKQLEEISGVPQSRISKLCSEDRKEVNLLMLERIADALDIKDLSQLIRFEDSPNE